MSRFSQDPVTLGATPIALEDTFRFGCVGCGNCCRGRLDALATTSIFLSGPDLARAADHLALPRQALIEKYTTLHADEGLGLILCRLRIRPDGSCRFLTKGQCTIYPVRPRTCALFPLSRGIIFKVEKGRSVYSHDEYCLSEREPAYKCTADQTYTAREWLDLNAVPVDDAADRAWFALLADCSLEVRRAKDWRGYQKAAFQKLYLDWDNKQFERKMDAAGPEQRPNENPDQPIGTQRTT